MMWNLGSGADGFSGWVSQLQAGPAPLLCLGSVAFLAVLLPAGLLALRLRLGRHLRSAADGAGRSSSVELRPDSDRRAEPRELVSR